MSERNLLETLRELGPEKVVDGSELCPCCDGLSPGISMDGETIVHCPVCHDRNVVTVEDADRWRNEMRKRQRAEIIASRVQFLGTRPAEAKATAEVEGDLASDDAPF